MSVSVTECATSMPILPGRGVPHRTDVRETVFYYWFREQLGVPWPIPRYGVRQTVEMPAGIQRALVVRCRPGDSNPLSRIARTYRQLDGDYAVHGLPEAPQIWLRRPSDPDESTVPVLCVLTRNDAGEAFGNVGAVIEAATKEKLELRYPVGDARQIAPNVPQRTCCHDPAGFFLLLPEAARRLEELGTAWIVVEFVMGGLYEGRTLRTYPAPEPGHEGW